MPRVTPRKPSASNPKGVKLRVDPLVPQDERSKFDPRGQQFTAEERAQVRELAGLGLPDKQIARVIRAAGGGIGEAVLQHNFRDELDCGRIETNAKVAKSLFNMAMDGKTPAAAIFWMKARCGWREKHDIEVTGKDGGPIQVQSGVLLIPTTVDAEAWERVVSEQQRKLAGPPVVDVEPAQ